METKENLLWKTQSNKRNLGFRSQIKGISRVGRGLILHTGDVISFMRLLFPEEHCLFICLQFLTAFYHTIERLCLRFVVGVNSPL